MYHQLFLNMPVHAVHRIKHMFIKKLLVFLYLPNLSSPKLPQPIFLPTRKLGPTINTPEVLTECRAGYIPDDPRGAEPPVAPPAGGAPL